jgi:glc operon protein GlcG
MQNAGGKYLYTRRSCETGISSSDLVEPITLDQAKAAMAAAEAKAKQNKWNVAISIVDSSGHAVMLHRLDGTQLASVRIAEIKARTAAGFPRQRRRLKMLLRGVVGSKVSVMEGSVPIIFKNKIIGGIGVSGVDARDDAQIARAGADAVK